MNPTRKYFSLDGQLMKMEHFKPKWLKGRHMVYEVLRSFKGKAVFLEDHIARMQNTARKTGIGDLPGTDDIRKITHELIDANGSEDGNILFGLVKEGNKSHFLACFIRHYYPAPEAYREGVYVRSLNAIRNNPNAKVFNPALRKKTEYLKETREAAEILLVDKDGCITEGSRSNIFLIRGNELYTPPAAKVLMGITRQKVLDICHKLGIRVTEQDILLREVLFYESAFITGTSPKVLPVRYIDKFRFNVENPIMRKIMIEFDLMMY